MPASIPPLLTFYIVIAMGRGSAFGPLPMLLPFPFLYIIKCYSLEALVYIPDVIFT